MKKWNWVNVVSIACGIVTIFGIIYPILNPSEFQCRARGTFADYSEPQRIEKKLDNKIYNSLLKYDSLQAAVQLITIYAERNKIITIDNVMSKVRGNENADSLLKSSFGYFLLAYAPHYLDEFAYANDSKYDDDYNSLWTFSIENIGNKELEDVALKLPFRGKAKIADDNGGVSYKDFINSLELGKIKPSMIFTITCWSKESSYSIYDKEKCRVIHHEGTFDVLFPDSPSGISALNKKFSYIPGLLLLLVVFIFLFVGVPYIIHRIKVSGYNKAIKELNNESQESPI